MNGWARRLACPSLPCPRPSPLPRLPPDTLPLGPFRFTPTGVRVGGRPEVGEFEAPLRFALWCQQAAPWWIGDLLNSGDDRFGEMFSQVCEGQISASLLQRYESVARRVPKENRNPNLSWSSHAAVARLPAVLQKDLLDRAERFGWNSTILARRARAEQARLRAAGADRPDPAAVGPHPESVDDEDDRDPRTEPAFREDVSEIEFAPPAAAHVGPDAVTP